MIPPKQYRKFGKAWGAVTQCGGYGSALPIGARLSVCPIVLATASAHLVLFGGSAIVAVALQSLA